MNANKENELIDYLNIIWRRKWIILIPTFVLMVLAGLYSMRAPVVWKMDAIIQPSRYMREIQRGRMENVALTDPSELAIQINRGAYINPIASALGVDPHQIPEIVAENLRDPNRPNYAPSTNLVWISTVSDDVERAKAVLYKLFDLIKLDLDHTVDVEMSSIETQIAGLRSNIKVKELEIKENNNKIELTKLNIKDKESEIAIKESEMKKVMNIEKDKELDIKVAQITKNMLKKEIESAKKTIKIIEDRITNLIEEKKTIIKRINDLDAQQTKSLAEKKKEGEAISLLLYSNEIQKNLQYHSELERRISESRVLREEIDLGVQNKQEQIKQADQEISRIGAQIESLQADRDIIKAKIAVIRNDIERIKSSFVSIKNQGEMIQAQIDALESQVTSSEGQKARIAYTEFVKEPSPSRAAIGRSPIRNIILVGFVCGSVFLIFAFLVDYIKRQEVKNE